MGRISGLARPSVCLRAFNSRTKERKKTKIGVNVSQNRSNQRVNLQFKRSEVVIRVRARLAQFWTDDRTIYQNWETYFSS